MKETVLDSLRQIEEKEQVKILLAVESGSRAWGMASADSDYDVRFLYVRQKNDYLRLKPLRDVIELPLTKQWDINGWDLKKALWLLKKSNPTLLEWFFSPIVYLETEYAARLKEEVPAYFSQKRCLYHYLAMAKKDWQIVLDSDKVSVKKYFYILRAVLACQWILEQNTIPPVAFLSWAKEALPPELWQTVQQMLQWKQTKTEGEKIERNDALDGFLIRTMEKTELALKNMKEGNWQNQQTLDHWFLQALKA